MARRPTTTSTTAVASVSFSRTAFVAKAFLAVLLGAPVGHSFAPSPITATLRRGAHLQRNGGFLASAISSGRGSNGGSGRRSVNVAAARGTGAVVCCLGAGGEEEREERAVLQVRRCGGGCGGGGGGGGRATRRRSSRLQAAKKDQPEGDRVFRLRNVGASITDEDKIQAGGEEEMKRLMFEMDPDSEEQGPMYFGEEGDDGPERIWEKPPEEIRYEQCYVAFCIDRDETPEEPKNFVFASLRQSTHMAHLIWARTLARTLENDPDREAAVLWNRSVLSPSKLKVMGNMICIRSHTKEGAIRLLEDDPFRKAGLYGTVSLYRYPYSQSGDYNWQQEPYPYMALCMDHKGKSELRKATRERHLEYHKKSRRCTGAGPIFDAGVDEDDPESVPIGSLVFINAGTDAEARETMENDPYNEAGLFESIFISRFNELDLDGWGVATPNRHDPMRNVMEKEGLAIADEYLPKVDWKPFGSLAWLDDETERKVKQEYMERRRTLYEERDTRIERGRVNLNARFPHGAYVYLGNRTDNEWYDFWPSKFSPDNGLSDEFFSMENSYPPVDVMTDDLDRGLDDGNPPTPAPTPPKREGAEWNGRLY